MVLPRNLVSMTRLQWTDSVPPARSSVDLSSATRIFPIYAPDKSYDFYLQAINEGLIKVFNVGSHIRLKIIFWQTARVNSFFVFGQRTIKNLSFCGGPR